MNGYKAKYEKVSHSIDRVTWCTQEIAVIARQRNRGLITKAEYRSLRREIEEVMLIERGDY